LAPVIAFCDSSTYKIIKKIQTPDAICMTTDKFGSVYIANASNTIYRFNSNGDSTGFYSSIRRGAISLIDATNPMRVLVYYADFQSIDVLDRVLSLKNTIDLRKLKIMDCPSISYSADGDTWVYNNFTSELLKVTDEAQTTFTSFNFIQQFQTNIQPTFITEQDKFLFIVDSTHGILKFDRFGTYINTYPFYCKAIQYIDNTIIYFKNDTLYTYELNTLKDNQIKIPVTLPILDIRIERNRYYVLTKNYLEIYE
jgi:hypothetical protein